MSDSIVTPEKLKEINDSMVTKYAKAIIHNLKLRVELETVKHQSFKGERDNTEMQIILDLFEAELAKSTSEHKEAIEKMEHYEKALKAVKKHIEIAGGSMSLYSTTYNITRKALE